jgi:dTDP-4-amino-4,6-dideoxygalactose transaminase
MALATREQPAIEGGSPVRDLQVRPWPKWPIYDEAEEQALLRVLRSGEWWSVPGGEGKAFEREFASYHDAEFGVACANGTVALEVALRALGIGCGDEVIVPAYTFVATASAVLGVSAVPVFVDIDPDTLNIDPAEIEAAITDRTAAVIPVHIAGRPADMDAILAIARKHNLAVIEDAAQAHAAAWRGTKVGAIGDIGTFSFQASKNLNAGEGGIVLSNREEVADAAWSVVNIGRVRNGAWYDHQVYGSNFRLTEFQSAVLRTQLARLPEQTARRTATALALRDCLSGIEGIRLPSEDPRITCHAHHLFTFRYDAAAFGGRPATSFLAALAAEGVPCSDGYIPLYREGLFVRHASRQDKGCHAGRQIDYPNQYLPVCEQVCSDCVWLEQSLLLSDPSEMADVATAVNRIQRAWTQ